VALVEARGHQPVVRVAGVVQPDRRAQMGTRQAGTVKSVLVEAGERVEADQPILRVDARDLEAARNAARLQRNAARAAWEQATQNEGRFRRLHEQELVARIRMEEAAVKAEQARGLLEQAEAELAAAEINLDYATLRAPFAGIVSEILAEEGSFVAPGPPLVVFEDRSRLQVDAGIDAASAMEIRVGQALPMDFLGIDGAVEGRVQAVLPALEDTGVGLLLRLTITDPPPGLEPGMVAEVAIPTTQPSRPRVSIPEAALIRRGQMEGVFVVEPDSDGQLRARLRWLVLAAGAADQSGRMEVERGLSGGERVVVGDQLNQLSDNQPVTVDEPVRD
jgi:RND family efflux transporter MFP subunit